jgi:hypothetical protein
LQGLHDTLVEIPFSLCTFTADARAPRPPRTPRTPRHQCDDCDVKTFCGLCGDVPHIKQTDQDITCEE